MNGSRRLLLWAVVTLGWIAILLPMTAPAGLFAYLITRAGVPDAIAYPSAIAITGTSCRPSTYLIRG